MLETAASNSIPPSCLVHRWAKARTHQQQCSLFTKQFSFPVAELHIDSFFFWFFVFLFFCFWILSFCNGLVITVFFLFPRLACTLPGARRRYISAPFLNIWIRWPLDLSTVCFHVSWVQELTELSAVGSRLRAYLFITLSLMSPRYQSIVRQFSFVRHF